VPVVEGVVRRAGALRGAGAGMASIKIGSAVDVSVIADSPMDSVRRSVVIICNACAEDAGLGWVKTGNSGPTPAV
jgi:hypothetical protein